MSAPTADDLRDLASALSCSQCGRPFTHRACGPTHAVIAANPRQHRLIAPLIDQARAEVLREAATEVPWSDPEMADEVIDWLRERAARFGGDPS